MLVEYYKDVSDERYNFPERVEEVIKVLEESLPDVYIIDSERKKKIEENYQHCTLTYDKEHKEEAEYGMYHLFIAFINNGIRLTYEIIIFEDSAYIDDGYTETNYGSLEVEEKIKNALEKCKKEI